MIDVFSSRNIPIKNMEKASGLIVTDAMKVNARDAQGLADCGKTMGAALYPTDATYNVLVRGDSAQSTVKVTVRWVRVGIARGFSTETVSEECSTTGSWETAFEASVKQAAEAKR